MKKLLMALLALGGASAFATDFTISKGNIKEIETLNSKLFNVSLTEDIDAQGVAGIVASVNQIISMPNECLSLLQTNEKVQVSVMGPMYLQNKTLIILNG